MMRASSQTIVPTVAPIWTNLVRVVLVIEVRVGLMVLFATLIIPGINSSHQVHLNSHWLTVFGLSLVYIHLLLVDEVVTLLNQLPIGRIFPRLLQADLRAISFALRSHLIVRL